MKTNKEQIDSFKTKLETNTPKDVVAILLSKLDEMGRKLDFLERLLRLKKESWVGEYSI